ncbi:phosphate carrier protein, mitochondrial-like isoform X3 [Athalia rosae]|uniref:phosphate carrier protein, mitochondrial-like isoform X3 n=1 Tax=Athalia rosae TaxID=37344 RepID=UPI00203439FE|nr:phosphate carrier protein, mitochondrial-like isoform X3 [Athalia rosae]
MSDVNMSLISEWLRDKFVVKADSTSGAGDGEESCAFGSTKYFLLCGLGGIVSCGTTHALITPLDLIKCRMQVDPAKYKNLGTGFKLTVSEEGILGLSRGWLPTLLGYSTQGLFKFGLYEFFKVNYAKLLGDQVAIDYRTWLYLTSSASAEFFADIGLAPMEAVKVRMQTSPGFTTSITLAMEIMKREGGWTVFYKGLVPLWLRQVPYTMMKFTCFEKTLEMLYRYVVPKPRHRCTKGEQLLVTFGAGYIAGVFCAVVSHPADTVVSKLNQQKGSTGVKIAREIGFTGLWSGLGPRIVMIGTLTALQWFIYDAFKVYMRMPRPPPVVENEKR